MNTWSAVRVCLVAAIMISGCGKAPETNPVPPPAVTIARPLQREVIEWDEGTGRLEAVETVDVRARVGGFIERADFVEGSLVKAGDLLFQIDPRQFNAELARTQADVAKAQAQLAYAGNEFKRIENLRPSGGASELELENARQRMLEAEATVAAAKAQVQAAQLNVDWTRVTAPISGRISRKYVTAGNLINGGQGQATLLTVITSIDPIYCLADANEQQILKYQRLATEGKRQSARDGPVPAFLQLSDETTFPREGVMNFVDNRLDPETGTIRARAVFPNPDGFLKPGMFARIRIPGSGRYNAILIPDSAVGADQNLRYVLLAKSDDTVELRPVQLGAQFGSLRAIRSGVGPEDRVIINGLQRARPGAKVSVTEQTIPPDALMLTAPGAASTQALPATTQSGGAR